MEKIRKNMMWLPFISGVMYVSFVFIFVDLSSCDLTQIPDATYFMLKNVTIETCDLSNNLIKRIPSKFCTKLPSLTGMLNSIDLSMVK